MIRICLLATILAGLTMAVGCGQTGSNRAAISGQVTLDGSPIEQGSILFVPFDGTTGTAAGGPIRNGRYELSGKAGATIGWNRVEIRSPRTTGRTIQYAPGTSPSKEVIQMVARRFNVESTLKIEVKPEQNVADFAVESQ